MVLPLCGSCWNEDGVLTPATPQLFRFVQHVPTRNCSPRAGEQLSPFGVAVRLDFVPARAVPFGRPVCCYLHDVHGVLVLLC